MSNLTKSSLRDYFIQTRSLLYSYLCSLPLFILYEVLIYSTQPDHGSTVRLAVDAWFLWLFSFTGYNVLSITLLVVAVVGLFVLYKERSKLPQLKLSYFFGIGTESLIYAVCLALFLSAFVGILFQIVPADPVKQLPLLDRIALSTGAGLYEELFFRVILVTLFVWFFDLLFTEKWQVYTAAILLASCLFSLAHYVGALGDYFTLRSFIFRLLFGAALSIIYWWRGFGAAAWTHSIYDLLITIWSY